MLSGVGRRFRRRGRNLARRRRLHDDSHGRARGRRRRLGNNRPCRRMRGDGRRRSHNGRRLAWRRNNLARLGTSGGRRRGGNRRGRGPGGGRGSSGPGGRAAAAGSLLFLLLLGLDRLQHIAWLGDVREVDLGSNRLGRAIRGSTVRRGRLLAVREVLAHLVGLMLFKRTGMGFAGGQTQFSQNFKNLLTLDFQLAREIVDSNLTHPPLFRICYPKPTSRS